MAPSAVAVTVKLPPRSEVPDCERLRVATVVVPCGIDWPGASVIDGWLNCGGHAGGQAYTLKS